MKKIYLALILFLLVMVVGCGKETEQKKNPYFQATVLEVKENSILVEPFEGEQELTSVDRSKICEFFHHLLCCAKIKRRLAVSIAESFSGHDDSSINLIFRI